MNAMKEKRNLILQNEEGRLSVAAERKLWMQQALKEQENEDGNIEPQSLIIQKQTDIRGRNSVELAEDENIDDDEFALARKLEREKEIINDDESDEEMSDDDSDYRNTGETFDVSSHDNVGETLNKGGSESIVQDGVQSSIEFGSENLVKDYNQNVSQSDLEALVAVNTQILPEDHSAQSNFIALNNRDQEQITIPSNSNDDEEREFDDLMETSKQTNGTGTKNSVWKAMLLKEDEQWRKQKKMRAVRDGFVEAEAEEEEEEEGVAGLEDFGFTIGAKKKADDDDEDNDQILEDDFDNIVDEVSDNEGDEEAGKKARKALEREEELARLKEIKRRVREGYDRQGIAGGMSSARGVHRFDQLVAADNVKEAKRLGIQNEDESDTESNNKNESNNDQGESDDEVAYLDKAIKARHLRQSDQPENFSDDEEDEEKDDASDEGKDFDRYRCIIVTRLLFQRQNFCNNICTSR